MGLIVLTLLGAFYALAASYGYHYGMSEALQIGCLISFAIFNASYWILNELVKIRVAIKDGK